MWIATAARSRALDEAASRDYGVPSVVLMERAGLSVFEALKQMLPEGGRVAVLCGKGNNGGDGLVVARLAYEARYGVECLVAASENELSPDAATQLAITRAAGVRPIFFDDARWQRRMDCLGTFDLCVDALLGTGAKGEIHGPIRDAIRIINRSGTPVIAVDVPSGIDTDTGEDLGDSIWALRTVTFGLPKPCFFQGIGLEHAGYWTVSDIGFPSMLLDEPTDARLTEPEWVANLAPERLRAAHKRDNGHVLIVAGSRAMPGAAVMSALGALRSGAGLVTVASVPSVLSVIAAHLPEVILAELPERDGFVDPKGAHALQDPLERVDSLVFGPGLGSCESVCEFLSRAFENLEHPCCLDADALNCLANGVGVPPGEAILTPHPGEMSRLLQCSIAEVQTDRFNTVREAVQKFGKSILLKGPHSIVGGEDQPLAVNCTGNPGMATAGMGDILSGMVGTLLAQDLPPYCAGAVAAYWHGLAGDLCADTIGPIGFLATDVAAMLPKARAKLSQSCEGRSRVRSSPLSCQA